MASRSVLETSPFPPLLAYEGKDSETVSMVSLPLSCIETPAFQRERKQRHIAKIFAEWDETAYVFPLIALYEDRFLALDGQQRIAAAEMRSIEKLVVLLVQGIHSKERLSALFLRYNRDRKLLDAFEKYIAAVTAKERGSVEIETKLSEYGLDAAKSAAITGKVPIGAVVQIHERGGIELLDRVLNIREQAWGQTPSREAFEGLTLIGLGIFLKRHWDEVDLGRVIAVLRKHHPQYILQAVRPDNPNRVTYAEFLERAYNKGLRGKARLA